MTMREILFRAKRNYNGEWVYGIYCPYNWNIFDEREEKPQIIIISDDKEIDGLWCEVIPETVGQYTGLTDKNGKRIFEGDILEGADYTPEDGGYGVVGFDDGAFEVSGNNCVGTFHENYWGREFEVIGNIHDNS